MDDHGRPDALDRQGRVPRKADKEFLARQGNTHPPPDIPGRVVEGHAPNTGVPDPYCDGHAGWGLLTAYVDAH